MSTSNPPLLHLNLPPPTQSFKRSFQQFGFDVESPTSGDSGTDASGSNSDGNERNKRPRSEGSSPSSSQESSDSSYLQALSSSEDGGDGRLSTQTRRPSSSGLSSSRPDVMLSHSASIPDFRRNPAPDIRDVTMADSSPAVDRAQGESWSSETPHSPVFGDSHVEEPFRTSLDRFREFDSHISALRRSPVPHGSPLRLRLPPVNLFEFEEDTTEEHPSVEPSFLAESVDDWLARGRRHVSTSASTQASAVDSPSADNTSFRDLGLLRPEDMDDLDDDEDIRSVPSRPRAPLPSRGPPRRRVPRIQTSTSYTRPHLPSPLRRSSPLPVPQRSSSTSHILPPFPSEEEERQSLREHVDSLLENMFAEPILPLSLSSPESDVFPPLDTAADRRRSVGAIDIRDAESFGIHRRNLPSRDHPWLLRAPSPAEDGEDVNTTRLRNASRRDRMRPVSATSSRPSQPSVEFQRYVARIPEPSIRVSAPLPERRIHPRSYFHSHADYSTGDAGDHTEPPSSSAETTSWIMRRRLSFPQNVLRSSRHSTGQTHARDSNVPRVDLDLPSPRVSIESELFRSDQTRSRLDDSASMANEISAAERRITLNHGETQVDDGRSRQPAGGHHTRPSLLPPWSSAGFSPMRHFGQVPEPSSPRRFGPLRPQTYGSLPTSPVATTAAERHRTIERARLRSELMLGNAGMNGPAAFQSRHHEPEPTIDAGESRWFESNGTHQRIVSRRETARRVSSHFPASSQVAEVMPSGHSLLQPRRFRSAPSHSTTPDVPSDVPSSSEAAAFFASGPALSTPTDPSAAMLRERRLMHLPDYMNSSAANTMARSPSLDRAATEREARTPFRTVLDGMDSIRLPSPETGSPTDGMLRTVFPPSGHPGRQWNADSFTDGPPPSFEGRRLPRPGPPPRMSGENDLGSRPPSLPPFRFEREGWFSLDRPSAWQDDFSSMYTDDANDWQRSLLYRTGRGLAAQQRQEAPQARSSGIDDNARERQEMHNLVTRRFRPEPIRVRNEGEPALPPPPPRSQGLQQALDVLRSDGLSPARQQQFHAAYQQDRARERTRPMRWGDIDDDDGQRTLSSIGEALRRRRNMQFFPPRTTPEVPGNSSIPGSGGPMPRRRSPSPTRSGEWTNPFNAFSAGRRYVRQRASRFRLQQQHDDLLFGDPPRIDLPHYGSFRLGRRVGRTLGDYVRDEDFDSSYESLLALAASLGEVKPRATPAHVIASLPTAFYKDWQTIGSDSRCPICLDDYKPLDPVLKLESCSHWFHKECLEQWLHSARTCPVCRKRVRASGPCQAPQSGASHEAGPSGTSHENHASDDSDSDGNSAFGFTNYS